MLLTLPPKLTVAGHRPTHSAIIIIIIISVGDAPLDQPLSAALIYLLHIITKFLIDNPYAVVIGLDFSKAFGIVRYKTLLEKLACFDLPDCVYNWLVDYFSGYSHCTSYRGHISAIENITASIV